MAANGFPPGTDFSKIPALPPPPGMVSNFVDPPSLFPGMVAVNVILMLWATVFVVIRLYINGRMFRVGDACCVLGLLLSYAYSILILRNGAVDRHQWDIPLAWLLNPAFLKAAMAIGILSGPGAFFAKLSIFLLYLHIFKVSNILRGAIYAGIIFSVILYWPFMVVMVYYCAPVVGESGAEAAASECGRLSSYTIAQGVAIVVLDLYIFLLPLSTVLRLRLSTAKRIAMLAVFMTASLGIVASICAMAFRIIQNDGSTEDGTWVESQLEISLTVENYVAVLVSCTPAVSHFVKRFLLHTTLGAHVQSRVLTRLGVSLPSPDASGGPAASPEGPSAADVETPSPKAKQRGFATRALSAAIRSTREMASLRSGDIRTPRRGEDHRGLGIAAGAKNEHDASDKESEEGMVEVVTAFQKQ